MCCSRWSMNPVTWSACTQLFVFEPAKQECMGPAAFWRHVWPTFRGAVLFKGVDDTISEMLLATALLLLCWQWAAVVLACLPCPINAPVNYILSHLSLNCLSALWVLTFSHKIKPQWCQRCSCHLDWYFVFNAVKYK